MLRPVQGHACPPARQILPLMTVLVFPPSFYIVPLRCGPFIPTSANPALFSLSRPAHLHLAVARVRLSSVSSPGIFSVHLFQNDFFHDIAIIHLVKMMNPFRLSRASTVPAATPATSEEKLCHSGTLCNKLHIIGR